MPRSRPNRAAVYADRPSGDGASVLLNEKPTVSSPPTTVHLPRVLRAPSERVYRAFLDPDAIGGTYLELTPHETIRYNDRFDDPNMPGEMQVTVTLREVACGTERGIWRLLPAIVGDRIHVARRDHSRYQTGNWMAVSSDIAGLESRRTRIAALCGAGHCRNDALPKMRKGKPQRSGVRLLSDAVPNGS